MYMRLLDATEKTRRVCYDTFLYYVQSNWGDLCDVLIRIHLDHNCLIPEHHTTTSMRKCKVITAYKTGKWGRGQRGISLENKDGER